MAEHTEPWTFQRFILWDYPRASRQYDLVVLLILAFIVFAPRYVAFRDQPRGGNIVMLAPSGQANVFWMEPNLLTTIPEPSRATQAATLLRAKLGKQFSVTQVEPIFDAEQDVKGFLVYTKL